MPSQVLHAHVMHTIVIFLTLSLGSSCASSIVSSRHLELHIIILHSGHYDVAWPMVLLERTGTLKCQQKHLAIAM